MSTPIHVVAKWKVKPGQMNAVLSMLKELAAKTREEKGNLLYELYRDRMDLNTLVLHEAYVDEAAQTFHKNSLHYLGLVVDKIMALLDNREVTLMTPMEV